MEALAPEIPKFISAEFGMKLIFGYWLGYLPFMKIPYDAFSAPFMTRDYLRMKLIEAKEKSAFYYIYIPLVILANWSGNRLMDHLNKRGIFTNYWVINDDDEL
jgi:hypothetical protein